MKQRMTAGGLASGAARRAAGALPGGAAAVQSVPAIPFKRDTSAVAQAGGTAVVLILLLLIVALGLLWKLRGMPLERWLRQARRAPLAQVLETHRLGSKTLVSVVQFGGQQHLIVHGEHGVQCVAQQPSAGAELQS